MCSRIRVVTIAAALAWNAALPLGAQRAESPEVRAQQRRADTLVSRWRHASRALTAFDDSVALDRAVVDTLRVGSLRLLVEPALRVRAEAAARIAAARIDSLAGSGAKRLERHWLGVRFANDSSQDSIVVTARSGNYVVFLSMYGVAPDSALGDWIFRHAQRLLGKDIDPPLFHWLREDLSPDTLTAEAWLSTRLAVLSADAIVARQCYEGDIAACRIVFDFVAVADPVMDLYDAAGRRRRVKSQSRQFYSGDAGAEAEDCVAGADAACIAFMRKHPELNDPVPGLRRLALATIAMQVGGRSGFERMLTATGAPAERLATAAGVPVDSVVRVWLARVRNTRLPSRDMTPGIAASSLGWMLVCGLLALRSSRWR